MDLLPIDILTIICQYCPAECIMLRSMSKLLNKAVSKSKYSIYLMHLFYMNKYGYIYNPHPNSQIIDVRNDSDIQWRFTDEVCSYMYKCGEPIKHIYVRNKLGYIKECLKRNDMISVMLMLSTSNLDVDDGGSSSVIQSKIGKYLIKTGQIKYRITINDPYIFDIGKIMIRKGLKPEEIEILIKKCRPSYIYELFKIGNYDAADMLYEKFILEKGYNKIILSTFIEKDNSVLLDLYIKRYKIVLDVWYFDKILKIIYECDAVNVFEYFCKENMCLNMINTVMITVQIVPKIAKFTAKNNIKVIFSFKDCYLFKNAYWETVYIPDSKMFRTCCMLEQFYPTICIGSGILNIYANSVKKMHKTITKTPHPYPFINKLFEDLSLFVRLIDI